MRPILITLLIACCGAFAQTRGGYGGRASTGRGSAPARPSAGRFFSGRGRTVIVPYPAYYGGYYLPPPGYGYGYDTSANGCADPNCYGDPGYGYGYGAGYGYGPGYADPSQPPSVIVNPGYSPEAVNPVIHDYSNTPLPEPTFKKYESPTHPYDNQTAADQPPTIYLIAMKDHTIFPAVAYWVDGNTLNYVTTEGSLNRATLDLVDRDFSTQLNQERQVEFHLPAQK